MRSGLPGVNYGHTCGLKVIHISGHNRHAVNKGSSRDESVTIGARTGHVERGETLVQAVARETREETAWRFTSEAFLGAYLWQHPGTGHAGRSGGRGERAVRHYAAAGGYNRE